MGTKTIQLTFLGSGGSMGIPQITCQCEVCLSNDPKDKRTRTGIWIRSPKHSLILDASADFRQQALANKIDDVHTICLSHMHSDHFLGLDDIRAFAHPINIYINPSDWDNFHYRYDYAIDKNYDNLVRPKFIPHKACEETKIDCQDFSIEPFPVNHGDYNIKGYLVNLPAKKRFAFITDCKSLDQKVMAKLADIDYLALACIWQDYRTHQAHLCLEEALPLIEQLRAKKVWLFHISHKMGRHKQVTKILPPHINLAYDGLKIDLT